MQSEPASMQQRIEYLQQRIAAVCMQNGRSANSVQITAVSKTMPAETVAEAAEAGLTHFGENYVQEALSKLAHPLLQMPDIRWHLLGHLQRNKVRLVVGRFALIESVDSLALLHELENQAEKLQTAQPVLLQVKLDSTPAKTGFAPADVQSAIETALQMHFIQLHGLMGIAPCCNLQEETRPAFRLLYNMFQSMPETARKILSMGMSADFETAIQEGATHVRIGTALFGQRLIKETRI